METVNKACKLSSLAGLFVSIGTSGEVWPAASIPYYAKENGALMIEINPETSMGSYLSDEHIRQPS